MKVLIAEDEVVTALALESLLLKWGHEPVFLAPGGPALVSKTRVMLVEDEAAIALNLRETP